MKKITNQLNGFRFNRAAVILGLTAVLGLLQNTGWCGRIIYPWRATTAIVKAGESFDVWFIADAGQTVTNAILNGPYNTVNPVIASPVTGNWVYDPISGNTYNTRITVTVPTNAPADRYDLVLQTSTGSIVSGGAAKIIKEYKNQYYILHISDVHRWQGGYDPTQLMRKVSAVIDIANIIDPEMIIETGDNYYPWKGNDVQTAARANMIFDGMPALGIKGEHDAFAATFMIAGNHDTPSKDIGIDTAVGGIGIAAVADYYNTYFGLHIYNFTYGEGRFLMVNDIWGGGGVNYTARANEAKAWLDNVGWGNFILAAGHVIGSGMAQTILKTSPTVIIAGHQHTAGDSNPYPTNGINQYVANSLREQRFEFNLYKVNNSNGTYEAVSGPSARVFAIQTVNNSTIISNWAGWIPNLSLTYAQTNNGTVAENTAIISNKYSFPITGARVRFVMPLGVSYGVSQGVISQTFDGDDFHIVDVSVDLSPSSTTSVDIFGTSVAANNAQFVSQDVPDSIEPGKTAAVSITMKNTGTNAWTVAAGHQLGTQNPIWTATNRIPLSQNVLPESSHTFAFTITAPDVPGNYDFQWKMVDEVDPDAGWFGQNSSNVTILVAEIVRPGTPLLAVDLHQNLTDPLPAAPSNFVAWMIGDVAASNAAPSLTTNGYTATLGSGTSVVCLVNALFQTGLNSRSRAGFIPNSGEFTQAEMMRERVGSMVNSTDPSSGTGKGNGLYLKISGLASNTPYVLQTWGVDSTTNSSGTPLLKNGVNFGFDATRETAGYTSLPLLGSYTVSGSPTVITNNNQYSVLGKITADSSGTIVYKQISDIDRSIMNGFVLYTVAADGGSGYNAWAATNSVGSGNEDEDGDGRSNFYEYVLNGNPNSGASVGTDPVFVKGERGFDYTHVKRSDDPSLTYTVEISTNLLSGVWTNAAFTAETNVTGGTYDEVTHLIPMDEPKSFIRLKVENR